MSHAERHLEFIKQNPELVAAHAAAMGHLHAAWEYLVSTHRPESAQIIFDLQLSLSDEMYAASEVK